MAKGDDDDDDDIFPPAVDSDFPVSPVWGRGLLDAGYAGWAQKTREALAIELI